MTKKLERNEGEEAQQSKPRPIPTQAETTKKNSVVDRVAGIGGRAVIRLDWLGWLWKKECRVRGRESMRYRHFVLFCLVVSVCVSVCGLVEEPVLISGVHSNFCNTYVIRHDAFTGHNKTPLTHAHRPAQAPCEQTTDFHF